MGNSVWSRFTGIDDNGCIVRFGNRSHAVTEWARKEIVPGGESIVRFGWITLEFFCKFGHGLFCICTKPAIFRIV